MQAINTTDRVVVIESEPGKLDAAIRTAMDEARKVIQDFYLSECKELPPITERVSTGKNNDHTKNGAHVVCHYLIPHSSKVLDADYVETLDKIFHLGRRVPPPPNLISQITSDSKKKSSRWLNNDKYLAVLRHGIRAVFVSLLRQRAVLLPADAERYVPCVKLQWRGYELMPERLQHMCAAYYAGSGLDYGIDWTLTNYTWKSASIQERGVENVPSKPLKSALVFMAMTTSWEKIEEVDPKDVEELKKYFPSNAIGLYLTYLYLRSPDKASASQKVFAWMVRIRQVRFYVEDFDIYANKNKRAAYRERKREEQGHKGKGKSGPKSQSSGAGRASFKASLAKLVSSAIDGDNINAALLAQSLGRLKGRTAFMKIDDWPEESLLPEFVSFDAKEQTKHWHSAFKQYCHMKKLSSEGKELQPFTAFLLYLLAYLPLYFHYNPDSDAVYPAKVEDLNGFHFVSRPNYGTHLKLPMPFVDFAQEFSKSHSQRLYWSTVKSVHRFFETILGRKELLGIPYEFGNPVLETDIPGSGGRPDKTPKTRLPTSAYFLSLAYCYKIYDYVSQINEKCLDCGLYANNYSVRFHRLDVDELGMFDIRDILGEDVDRTIMFKGVKYEVNLVPTHFFWPRVLPLKGLGGNRVVIRPHSIVHQTTALETGIRNAHLQWLCNEFDKKVTATEIVPEEVYRLFVKTDKKNKSWTAQTAGRVIKILREQRIFRDLIDADTFDEKLYYKGRTKNPKYPPFKVLFAFDLETGSPYNDGTYESGFQYLMVGVQHLLDRAGIDFPLYDLVDIDAQRREDRFKLRKGLSPHAMRVTVVGVHGEYLSPEYIGRYITNQTLATVMYYTKWDAEQIRKMEEEQARGISQFSREGSKVQLLGEGGVTIDTTDPNSVLGKAFRENPEKAIPDFGAVSSQWFDRETDGQTGISILLSNRKLTLAFETTHICPFNRICPDDRRTAGLANRCFFCDYAIRTVDHLPALGSARRDLVEELEELERQCEQNADKWTEAKLQDIDERIAVIGVDLGSIDLNEKILEENLRRLNAEDDSGSAFHTYKPDAVLQKLEKMPFPDKADESRYVMARLSEVVAYPTEIQNSIKMKLMAFKNNILANTGNVRAMLKRGGDISPIETQVYSIVNSLKRVHSLSLDQIAEIASRDIDEIAQLGLRATYELEAPTLKPVDDLPDGTGTDG